MSDFAMVIAIAIAGVTLVYALASLRLFLTQHKKIFLVPKVGKTTPMDWGLDYDDLTLTSQGKKLQAWWIPGKPDRPVILFCHGNGVTIHHLAPHVLFLRPLETSIFLFDYQGYGNSEGQASETATYADAEAAWRYLTAQRGIKGENILIYGHSLGGGIATWLAARYASGGIILEGTFTSIPDLATDYYPLLPVRKLARIDYNNLANIKTIRVPVFIAHSMEDKIIPFHHGDRLFQAANHPKRLLPIKGNHIDAFVQTKIDGVSAIDDFFRTAHLPGSRGF